MPFHSCGITSNNLDELVEHDEFVQVVDVIDEWDPEEEDFIESESESPRRINLSIFYLSVLHESLVLVNNK